MDESLDDLVRSSVQDVLDAVASCCKGSSSSTNTTRAAAATTEDGASG
jgi:hypothetical protein